LNIYQSEYNIESKYVTVILKREVSRVRLKKIIARGHNQIHDKSFKYIENVWILLY